MSDEQTNCLVGVLPHPLPGARHRWMTVCPRPRDPPAVKDALSVTMATDDLAHRAVRTYARCLDSQVGFGEEDNSNSRGRAALTAVCRRLDGQPLSSRVERACERNRGISSRGPSCRDPSAPLASSLRSG